MLKVDATKTEAYLAPCLRCIGAKISGTSEPFFQPNGKLSPTGKYPFAFLTVAKLGCV